MPRNLTMGMAADASASIDALQQAAAHTGNFHLQRFPAVDVFRLRGGRWNRRTLAWHTKESTCRELRQVLLRWTVSVVVPMADTQYASFSFSVNHIRPVLRAGTGIPGFGRTARSYTAQNPRTVRRGRCSRYTLSPCNRRSRCRFRHPL